MFEDTIVWLKQQLVANKVDFVDFFSKIHNGNGGWPKDCCEDDVHPNKKGYRLMFEQIGLNIFQ
jgi:lysophospholipase L1-like esterase